MPNNFDFSKLEDVKTIEVNPTGWITPLFVEYGIYDTKFALIYCWRVKGTQHTFMILVSRMDFLSSGNYKGFFENALEIFREDYIDWKNDGFVTEWSKEYREQFSKFIVT